MDPIQQIPFLSIEAMVTKDYGTRQWLQYYKNIWERNVSARLIDVYTDTVLKAKDANMPTDEQDTDVAGRPMFEANNAIMKPVKKRLEERKIALQDGIDILKGISAVLALDDAAIAKMCSPEALKVAEDMLPKPPAAATPAAPSKDANTDSKV